MINIDALNLCRLLWHKNLRFELTEKENPIFR